MAGDLLTDADLAAYADAAAWAGAIVASPAVAARWDGPSALAEMTVGAVAAHLAQAGVGRVDQVLRDPVPEGFELVDLAGFFGGNRMASPAQLGADLPSLLRQMAAEQAAKGPAEVAAAYRRRLARVTAALPSVPADRPVPTVSVPRSAAPFELFVRTRVVELLVHGDDLLASPGVGPAAAPGPPPPAAVDVAVGVLMALSRARVGDAEVLRALARAERARPDALRAL